MILYMMLHDSSVVVQEAVCVCLPCVTEIQFAVGTVPDCLLSNCRLSMVAAKPASTSPLLAGGLPLNWKVA